MYHAIGAHHTPHQCGSKRTSSLIFVWNYEEQNRTAISFWPYKFLVRRVRGLFLLFEEHEIPKNQTGRET